MLRLTTTALRLDKLNAERAGKPDYDLILQAREVGLIAIEAVRPEIATRREVGQGNIDAHVITSALYGSLHSPSDPQLLAEHLQIDPLVLVCESGTAPDHESVGHSSEV